MWRDRVADAGPGTVMPGAVHGWHEVCFGNSSYP